MKLEDIVHLMWEFVAIERLKNKDINIREFTVEFARWLKKMRVLSGKPLYSFGLDALLRQVNKAIKFLVKERRAERPKRGWIRFKDVLFYNDPFIPKER